MVQKKIKPIMSICLDEIEVCLYFVLSLMHNFGKAIVFAILWCTGILGELS